jgi:DNA-binding protein H-NS
VNENARATKPKQVSLDLSEHSDEELEVLMSTIESELAKRHETRKREALEKIREVAKSVGMTAEELLGLPAASSKKRRGKRTPPAAVRHPDDPELVYQGGRKPAWLKKLNEEGREPVKVA